MRKKSYRGMRTSHWRRTTGAARALAQNSRAPRLPPRSLAGQFHRGPLPARSRSRARIQARPMAAQDPARVLGFPRPSLFTRNVFSGNLVLDGVAEFRTRRNRQAKSSRRLRAVSSGFAPLPREGLSQTLCQLRLRALCRTASQTRCVSKASRNVGPTGVPAANPCRKSAT
jgi:hypothetical protein